MNQNQSPQELAKSLVPTVESFSRSKPIVIYMKGSPEFPMCGFSAKACQVMQMAGAARSEIASFDLLSDEAMWGALEMVTEWPTSPQIFVGGEFIGGCDIVTELQERGELSAMLEAARKVVAH